MFCGNFGYAMDNRGELVVPVRFRRGKKSKRRLVVGAWPEGCLFLFSKKEWKKVKRTRLYPLEATNREEIRIMFSHTVEIEMNEKGEIKIPTSLRSQAGLKNEVAVVGCGRYMEIWDKKGWEAECERLTVAMEALYEEVVKIPLNISSN